MSEQLTESPTWTFDVPIAGDEIQALTVMVEILQYRLPDQEARARMLAYLASRFDLQVTR